jgi:selenocysteine lyase/cysteine desulfurase
VVVREIEPEDGGVTVAGVLAALTERTRLVAVSSVQYATGIKTDLEAIGKLCEERGVFLCVDGIQSVGAFPIELRLHREVTATVTVNVEGEAASA